MFSFLPPVGIREARTDSKFKTRLNMVIRIITPIQDFPYSNPNYRYTYYKIAKFKKSPSYVDDFLELSSAAQLNYGILCAHTGQITILIFYSFFTPKWCSGYKIHVCQCSTQLRPSWWLRPLSSSSLARGKCSPGTGRSSPELPRLATDWFGHVLLAGHWLSGL